MPGWWGGGGRRGGEGKNVPPPRDGCTDIRRLLPGIEQNSSVGFSSSAGQISETEKREVIQIHTDTKSWNTWSPDPESAGPGGPRMSAR